MSAPAFESGQFAQAIYSWSTTRIDSTPGLGFVAISPLLVPHVAWLSNTEWPEFRIERASEVTSGHARLASTGRTCRGATGVVYRKIRNNRKDAKGRTTIFVHAVFGRGDALLPDLVDRISEEFWLPEDVSERARLVDIDRLDVTAIPAEPASTPNIMPMASNNPLELILPDSHSASSWLRLFPDVVQPWLCLDTFVYDSLRQRRLWISSDAPEPVLDALLGKEDTRVGLLEAIGQGAPRPATGASNRTPRELPRHAPADGMTSAVHNALVALLGPDMTGVLSDGQAANLALRLSAQNVSFEEFALLRGPDAHALFGGWDGAHLRDWVELSRSLSVDQLVATWNRHPSAMLLGVMLARSEELEGRRPGNVSLGFVRDSDSVVNTLKHTLSSGRGLGDIRRLASLGFWDSEAFRRMLVSSLAGQPRVLFDGVLAWPEIPAAARFDLMKLAWNSWVTYRRIPPLEAEALSWRFRSGLFTRLFASISGPRRDAFGAAGSSTEQE